MSQQQQLVEQIVLVRPVAFPQAELIVASNSARSWKVFHERYAICAIRTGAAESRYCGKTLPVHDGSLLFMEPNETHSSTAYKPGEFIVLQLEPACIESDANELGLSGTPHLRTGYALDCRLHTAAYGFSDSVRNGAAVLEQQSWLTACVRLFLGYAERRPPDVGRLKGSPAIDRARSYLRDRFAEPVTLDELSAVAGISRFNLVRQFTKRFGFPPHAYQTHLRVERARNLLRADMPIAGVAAFLGFADQSHLARHFKKAYGVTPGDYARWTRLRGDPNLRRLAGNASG
jgi:AraC-like DNA-binding protein